MNWYKTAQQSGTNPIQLPPIMGGHSRILYYTTPAMAISAINGGGLNVGANSLQGMPTFANNNQLLKALDSGGAGNNSAIVIIDLSAQELQSAYGIGVTPISKIPDFKIVGVWDKTNRMFNQNADFNASKLMAVPAQMNTAPTGGPVK